MAVEIEGLPSGERVHTDGAIIQVVTNVEFSLCHGTEHVRQATHRVDRATAEREGCEREIEMIRQRTVVPHY